MPPTTPLATPRGAESWGRWSLRIPLFGPIILKATMSRFSRTLAMCLRSGVALEDSVATRGNLLAALLRAKRDGLPLPAAIAPGTPMADGTPVPPRHDGMGAFGPGRGDRRRSTLVRNHEENGSAVDASWGGPNTPTYDRNTHGGTSTVHVTDDGQVQYAVSNLPPRIAGQPVVDRLSFHFRSGW